MAFETRLMARLYGSPRYKGVTRHLARNQTLLSNSKLSMPYYYVETLTIKLNRDLLWHDTSFNEFVIYQVVSTHLISYPSG